MRGMLILVVFSLPFGSGCMLFKLALYNIANEPGLTVSNGGLHHRAVKLAEEAYAEYCVMHGGHHEESPFQVGFIQGYADYLDNGGNGAPPTLPPANMRRKRDQDPDGHAAIEEFYLGFSAGAAQAKASGLRQYFLIPLSTPYGKQIAPSTPTNRNDEQPMETLPPPKKVTATPMKLPEVKDMSPDDLPKKPLLIEPKDVPPKAISQFRPLPMSHPASEMPAPRFVTNPPLKPAPMTPQQFAPPVDQRISPYAPTSRIRESAEPGLAPNVPEPRPKYPLVPVPRSPQTAEPLMYPMPAVRSNEVEEPRKIAPDVPTIRSRVAPDPLMYPPGTGSPAMPNGSGADPRLPREFQIENQGGPSAR